jgi:hypothetical protein
MTLDEALQAFGDRVSSMIGEDIEAAGRYTPYQPTIFHYTDVKGALGILQSGELWFTECAHMNDPIEIQYGLRIARDLFGRTAQRRNPRIPNDTVTSLKEAHGSGRFGFWIFSASLSDDHLGQWRSYADDGRGACLGFSLEKFNMVELAKLFPHALNPIRFPTNYDEGRLRANLQRYVDGGLDILAEIDAAARADPWRDELFVLSLLNDGFYANAILSKHVAYEQEREYRLLISGERERIGESNHHHLRERNREIVGFLKLPIPEWRRPGVLTHIRIGPAAPNQLMDQLRGTLAKLGIPIPQIDRSDIPYRSVR